MSGLLALLDDVAGIAKVAAASIDDVAAQALKAGSKAAGAVIDDAAVTPKYVQGFDAARELPIIWRIARGSIFNKLVILLPLGLILANFAPFLIPPLLLLGGGYLCFEGAEKIAHWLFHSKEEHAEDKAEVLPVGEPAHLEEEKIKGAIKTDFILSAEIMTIALAAIPESGFWMEASTLAVVAVGITVAVYGSVALIVKADDVGLALASRARTASVRSFGSGLVKAMPNVLKTLSSVGTAAMLWVGGSIIIHSVKDLGWTGPYSLVHDFAHAVSAGLPDATRGFVEWCATAFADGIFGIAVGLGVIVVLSKGGAPLWKMISGK